MQKRNPILLNELTDEYLKKWLIEQNITETNFSTHLQNTIDLLNNDGKNQFSRNIKDDKDFAGIFNNSDKSSILESAYKKLSYLPNSTFRNIYGHVDSDIYDIFLSHAYKDKYLVYGLYLILTKEYQYKVYVDWIVDTYLSFSRSYVATRNIRILQIRMLQSKALVMVKSKNFRNSKWIAWEIGYFNGKSNNIYVQFLEQNDEDDDKVGFGFLKLYRKLYLSKRKFYYMEDKLSFEFTNN